MSLLYPEIPESALAMGKQVLSIHADESSRHSVEIIFSDGSKFEVHATNCDGEIDWTFVPRPATWCRQFRIEHYPMCAVCSDLTPCLVHG